MFLKISQIPHENTFVGVSFHFEEGGGYVKNEMLLDVGGEGVASVLDFQSLFFLLKKIGFSPWPGIMLSETIYYWQEIFLLTPVSGSEAIV